MAVIEFKWIHDGRGGEDDITGEETRTRVARIQTDSRHDAEVAIKAAADANGAAIGDSHPDGGLMWLQRRRADAINSYQTWWLLTCDYSNKLLDNPLNDPAEIDSTTEKLSRILIRDRNGNWVANSAGFPYDPPAEVDDSRTVFRVSKNVADRPTWYPMGYKDAVNDDVFTIDGLSVLIGKAKIESLSLSAWKKRSGVDYRTLGLTIAVDALGWDVHVLDAGYMEKDAATPSKKGAIQDDKGFQSSTPWPLDGAGRKLADPSPANFVYRTHEAYQRKPFSALPLT